jgi:hypothetical protein
MQAGAESSPADELTGFERPSSAGTEISGVNFGPRFFDLAEVEPKAVFDASLVFSKGSRNRARGIWRPGADVSEEGQPFEVTSTLALDPA